MLRVLAYHRVGDPSDPRGLDPALISATPEAFLQQMRHLRRWYEPVGQEDILAAFLGGSALPPRAVHVTVDDAYRDFAEVTWPILREFGIPVTVFVPTTYPSEPGREFWWDRLHRLSARAPRGAWRESLCASIGQHGEPRPRPAGIRAALRRLPHDTVEALLDAACREVGLAVTATHTRPPVLDWDELRVLAREGVRFGAHTRDHVSLSYVDDERLRREIRGSLEDLDRELGGGPWPLAYPYGVHNDAVVRVAEAEGCPLAFTCDDGLSQPGRTDPMRLPRTNITPRTTPRVFTLRMLPWFAGVDQWRHRDQTARNRA